MILNTRKLFLFFAVSMGFAATAQDQKKPAPSFKHEIQGSSGSLTFDRLSYSGKSANNFGASAGAAYFMTVSENLQLGIKPTAYFTHSSSVSDHYESIMVGPRFNIMSANDNMNAALYADVMGGTAFGKDYNPDLRLGADVGKRIPLADNVSYSPEFSYRFIKHKGFKYHTFSLDFLQFSILL